MVIKNPALSMTVDMMNSSNYKDRFIAEYLQLAIRERKLRKMLNEWNCGILTFEPTCPKSTYELQIEYMRKYSSVLEMRAKMENIQLPTLEESEVQLVDGVESLTTL